MDEDVKSLLKNLDELQKEIEYVRVCVENMAEVDEKQTIDPPYGVPLQLRNVMGTVTQDWWDALSIGNGQYTKNNHVHYLEDIGDWKYQEVDWSHVSKEINRRVIYGNGSVIYSNSYFRDSFDSNTVVLDVQTRTEEGENEID